MKIILDWVLFQFSDAEKIVLITFKDDNGYYSFTLEYDDELVTSWCSERDVTDGIVSKVEEPVNSSEYYHKTIENILNGTIM